MAALRSERKEQTRDAIVRSAARILRERGVGATGVAEVMKGAGLTVGGFYAHFPSKEALVAEAFVAAAKEAHEERLGIEHASLAEVVARYASPMHRDHPTQGCPVPAVLSEMKSQPEQVRTTFAQTIEQLVCRMSKLSGDDAEARRDAAAALALMVGALTLSRALAGSPLSDEVLGAAASLARESFGKKEK